jgi:hypothetical protein
MRPRVLLLALCAPLGGALALTAATPEVQPRAVGAAEVREAALREHLRGAPDDLHTYRTLTALAEGRPLTRSSAAYDTARAALPPRFVETQTSRYVILSDAEPARTAVMARHLERAHEQFRRFCRRLDLRPLPLRHKLLCVLFRDRADYRAFATEHDGVNAAWIAGYYAPRHDRVVFYDVRTNPSVSEARERLDQLGRRASRIDASARIAHQAGRSEEAASLREGARTFQRHITLERERVDAFTERVGAATTLHEAAHQLLFHTEVQSPRHHYPMWLSEGLAVAFESDRPDLPFGPDRAYEPRETRWGELVDVEQPWPLERLIPLLDAPESGEAIEMAYHQSYALVRWIESARPQQLRTLLMAYRRAPAHADIDHHALFEEAFGDVNALERAWLAHEHADD